MFTVLCHANVTAYIKPALSDHKKIRASNFNYICTENDMNVKSDIANSTDERTVDFFLL